jgi:hypothetical protein
MTTAEASDTAKALEAWATDGKIGDHKLKVTTSAETAPLTDVNSNCIRIVDDFYFEDQEDAAVYGITFPIVNKTTAKIVSANIVLSRKAFEKTPRISDGETYSILYTYVVSHEFGHFLGLDHEFTRDEYDDAVYPSIMSYDFDDIEDYSPRAHDREAIAELYGE